MGWKITNHIPEKGLIGTSLRTPISFKISDTDGVQTNTIDVRINGTFAIVSGNVQGGFSGIINQENPIPTIVTTSINPDIDFSYSQEVSILIRYRNHANILKTETYNFITVTDPREDPILVAANVKSGSFNQNQTITLEANKVGITIYYTTDGDDPTLNSNVYSTPIDLTNEGTTTLKFIGIDSNKKISKKITETYVLDFTPPVVTADPAGDNYYSSQEVTLAANEEASIFFTTDGSIPTTNSQLYTESILVPENQVTTLKFLGLDTAGNLSSVFEEIYNIERCRNNIIVQNVHVTNPYIAHTLDISWDDMYPIYTNIIGYNIYRADVESGPYTKLNDSLITTNQYRDQTVDLSIVNEDVSEQFRRTVNISRQANDDFSQPALDVSKWNQLDIAQLLFQNDNKLIFSDKTGLSQESKITSKFKLKNDFDIQISYSLYLWNAPSLGFESCALRVKTEDSDYIQVSRDRSQSVNVYNSNRFINGNPDIPISSSTIHEKGVLRIVRVDDIITTYFYDEGLSSFVTLQSFQEYNQDLYVEVIGKSANIPVEIRWTNFLVNSGTPIIIEPLGPLQNYFIQVGQAPIVDSSGTGNPTDDISEVAVTIDGKSAYIKKVSGYEGLIELDTEKRYDEVKRQFFTPPKPDEFSTVLVSYKTKQRSTSLALKKWYYYKITAVTETDETDLDLALPFHLEPEKLTYIFKEAIRRNSWILDNAGERVLLFLRKRAGQVCYCLKRDIKERTHKQADYDCPSCYGTGFVGGYDGPYPIRIAQPISEKRIMHTERGLTLQDQVETWTGPSPIMTQRDLIIRRNSDRCLAGPITPVEGPGGEIVQQHFTIEVLDRTDIRYQFPIQPLLNQYSDISIDKKGIYTPEINSSKEREELRTKEKESNVVKGRSIRFNNVNY